MNALKVFLILVLLSVGCSSSDDNNANNGSDNNGTTQKVELDYDAYDAILGKHVDVNGQVDYTSLKADDASLRTFVQAIGDADLSAMNDDEKLAFYINAYNSVVLLDVIDRYPIAKVIDIDGFFDKETHKVAGQMTTLDALENEIIRPTFNEPRIHFALVCAAKSCPPLQQKAYRAESLESKFEEVTKSFIEMQTTVDGKTITTSKIFDWFGEDFVAHSGSLGQYLAIYLPDDKDALEAGDATFEFTEYEWALNEQ